MPKTIVIDARQLNTSSGRYVERLLYYLQDVDKKNQYKILLKPKDMDTWQPRSKRFIKVPCRDKQFTFAEQTRMLWQIYRLKPDLVHFCFAQQPLLYFGKAVTTVHDLTATRFRNPFKNRMTYSIKQSIYKLGIKIVAHKSAAIITPTEFVKDDLAKFARINSRKITVTYEAADEITARAETVEGLKDQKFIVYVGRPSTHKNLNRLIEAFAKLKEMHPDLKLILAGKRSAAYRVLASKARLKGVTDVVFTGFISEGQLRWLYENAAAYVFPSLSEGFGLPGLEAMAHGCPVVSSNATCLPEVYGEAAHYFDPENTDDIAQKISEVLRKDNLRQTLKMYGYKQIKKFSWERMAQQTVDIYASVLEL